MLSLAKIELRRGSKLLFEQASFQVHAGQRLGLVGANGCGKSSLFSLLLGEIDADAGELAIPPGAQIAHVAQSSPSGMQSALDFVQDGDRELREVQALLKQAELAPERDSGHGLYERLDAIDGFSAEHDSDIDNPKNPMFFVVNFKDVTFPSKYNRPGNILWRHLRQILDRPLIQ